MRGADEFIPGAEQRRGIQKAFSLGIAPPSCVIRRNSVPDPRAISRRRRNLAALDMSKCVRRISIRIETDAGLRIGRGIPLAAQAIGWKSSTSDLAVSLDSLSDSVSFMIHHHHHCYYYHYYYDYPSTAPRSIPPVAAPVKSPIRQGFRTNPEEEADD
ncbi:hypothetical protein BO78DRAFT_423209 [Aspergillus sclerotiicarbonarius CBS 121057]|uniref:Uncharacterized protein n=1 Tax=Aspergillus sclerotiicarbonarius (strain CBS 121057 / IBT 28362) TaxID=1448318 RepID=A0A319DVD6_ASPSB|nr:hypothetical protein BO78DRAFT_423209 [Aspergillus sclerotiicarbonarius CBS 121057]